MYESATPFIHINGHRSSSTIRRAIRQACPLSMQLFAVFETPALYPRGQTGIQIGRPSNMVVVAYADNVTIFVTSDDIRTIQDAISCYEAASGA